MAETPAGDARESSRGVPAADRPPHRAPSDADVAAVAAGDDEAFALLYLDLQPRLRRYVMGLVGEDADDITAEAWLQIARDVHHFSGDLDDFRAWTTRIVRNRAMDHVRSRARRATDPVPLEDLPPLAAPDDPEAAVMDRLATADAIALIGTLPADQAEAVLLRTVVGLDARTSASVLGKNAGAVRIATHRGLKTLARRLRGSQRNQR